MNKSILVLTSLLFFVYQVSFSQNSIKPQIKNHNSKQTSSFSKKDLAPVSPFMPSVPTKNQDVSTSHIHTFQGLKSLIESNPEFSKLKVKTSHKTGRPIFIKGKLKTNPEGDSKSKSFAYLESLQSLLEIKDVKEEFEIIGELEDELGHSHVRFRQVYQGIPIYGTEIIVHTKNNIPFLMNGKSFPSPEIENLSPSISTNQLKEVIVLDLEKETIVKELSSLEKQLIDGDPFESELVIFYPNDDSKEALLAWDVSIIPNISSKWAYIVNAHTGEVLKKYNKLCQLHHSLSNENVSNPKCNHDHSIPFNLNPPPPTTADAQDLFGITRTIDVFDHNGTFFMIDASRPMFNVAQTSIPDDLVGAIWTIDAQNTSPENDDFAAQQIISPNNNWNNPTAVSAHYNAGKAYEYFKNTFNRNSINGQGGNIISLINVADADGGDMDNAFWNGVAMFYGNGDQAFTAPLAKSLDVGAHEMGHGVIQATANLEYYGESGALNESYADIFGAMVDRDDWKLGEDVVNSAIFSTGALRDMENPNNGGNSLNDPGWQPAHTSEQYLGNQDNAGVHINSGIPNKAYYLFAEDVGKDKAEQIFYRALDKYLVRSSQFIDLRLSVVQSAADLHGANSAEVNSAKSAFDQVGILNGSGTDTQVDTDANEGDDFILFTTSNLTDLFIYTPEGDEVADPISFDNPLSKPSVTDDGSAIVFIASDGTMQAITIDWINGSFEQNQIHPDPVWRNVAIAKDGSRVAALSDVLLPEIQVFDFGKSAWETYDLFNPTTATGGASTGDVLYADVLEFDFTGEFIMYDAINRIENNNGDDIEYWDIGFVNVWNNSTDNWGDNFISKLFSGLPENTSVGNPTFSKNSDFIIAFDFIDEFFGDYSLMGANIETGEVGTIFENLKLSYPNYSVLDDQMVFDAQSNQGEDVLAFIPLGSDKISASGDPSIYFVNTSWGTWFANGHRDLTDTEFLEIENDELVVYPNPADNQLIVEVKGNFSGEVVVEIIDDLGRRISQNSYSVSGLTFKETINLKELSSGNYFLKVYSEEEVYSKMFIKN